MILNKSYLVILAMLLISCGSEDTPKKPDSNNAPQTPETIFPLDNTLCTNNVLTFQWKESTDLDKDILSYHIQIAKNNQFLPIVQEFDSNSTSKEIALEKGTAYYWRIKALDNKNLSSDYSTTNKFYTEGIAITNHVPFAPEIISPLLNKSIDIEANSVQLQWSASDVDTSDSLTFDVYLDDSSTPIKKVATDISTTSYKVPVNAKTTYYWKIVVKDNHGALLTGQIWSFKTN